jgi:hypothetical protein
MTLEAEYGSFDPPRVGHPELPKQVMS